jgi:hypothetical protein
MHEILKLLKVCGASNAVHEKCATFSSYSKLILGLD